MMILKHLSSTAVQHVKGLIQQAHECHLGISGGKEIKKVHQNQRGPQLQMQPKHFDIITQIQIITIGK